MKIQSPENLPYKEALELIVDISVDYDGYHSAEKLKELIDEIKDIAISSLRAKNEG